MEGEVAGLLQGLVVESVVSFVPDDSADAHIEYKWFDVGVLDYAVEDKRYLVQKVSSGGRIVTGGTDRPGQCIF